MRAATNHTSGQSIQRRPQIIVVGAGIVVLTIGLGLWHIIFDYADLFAAVLATFGIAALFGAERDGVVRPPFLKMVGWIAIVLAIAASFSLGAFLPTSVAEWFSPVLSKFGGAAALAIITLGFLAKSIVARRSAQLDLMFACAFGAVWLWHETARQATFPTPPTTATALEPRIALGLMAACVFTLTSIGLYVFGNKTMAAAAVTMRWAAALAVAATVALVLIGSGLAFVGAVLILVVAANAVYMAKGLRWRALAANIGKLTLLLVLAALAYFTTTEDLEPTMLRNTAEYRVQQFWRGVFGDERFAARPSGKLSGVVRAANGTPVAGAVVIVTSVNGQTYSATTGSDGTYTVAGVPTGNYLPMAVAAGYQQATVRNNFGTRVVTLRDGQTTTDISFSLQPKAAPTLMPGDALVLDPPTTVSRENPEPSTAIRRSFRFVNKGLTLTGGLVHEPPAEMGAGPFPVLLAIYPGEAGSWEGVSIPLAAKGYVVISYFPRRLLDLDGDMADLDMLLAMVRAGKLSQRGDGSRIAIIGGSVSTAYTYALERSLEGSPARSAVRASVQYGGLSDLYLYRHTWESGKLIIDPGISALEYILVAFGRPDSRPELYARFSPAFALRADSLPPTLLVHATKDVVVAADQSQRAADALAQAGIAHKLVLYTDIEHYLDTSKRDPAQKDMLDQTLAFLEAYLK